MKNWRQRSLLEKVLLLALAGMTVFFLLLYLILSRMPGVEYCGALLLRHTEGETVTYSGKARGQRVDITEQVDEKTPYVDTWWDGEGNLYYVIVGGTPEDYGWYEGVTVPDGSGGGSGILSSRTDISPGEQNDVEWFTRGREQVREQWYARWQENQK